MTSMRKSIRFKIYAVTIPILAVVVMATSFIDILQLRSVYFNTLQEHTRAAARDLRQTLSRNLEYFPLESLSGMVSYLRKFVSTHEHFAYCYIADRDGKILYHNDTSFVNQHLPEDVYRGIEYESVDKGALLRTNRYYETILPLIRHGEIIGTIHIGTPEKLIDGTIAGIIGQNVLILGVALIFSIFLFYSLITRNVTQPIARLATQASFISSQFHLDRSLDWSHDDELEQFARSFETMMHELKSKTVSIGYVQDIIESMTDGLLVIRSDGIIERVNKALYQISGYEENQMIGQPLEILFANHDPAFNCPYFLEGIKQDKFKSYETRIRTRSGKDIPVLVSCSLMQTHTETSAEQIVCTLKDISVIKETEAALQEIQRQQRAILNNIPDIAWLKDRESRFIAVNEPFGKACGFPPEEVVGKNDLDIWPKELAEGYRADDREVMESGRRKRVEEQLADKEDKIQWIETIKTPIYNEKGEVIGTTGIARDITERKRIQEEIEKKQRELEAANESLERNEKALETMLYDLKRTHEELKNAQWQLVQSEKLASIGQLAAGIAHEINNPVGFITSNLSTLSQYVEHMKELLSGHQELFKAYQEENKEKIASAKKRIAGLEKAVDLTFILKDVGHLLRESEEGADRIKKIVANLKSFAHRGDDARSPADLNQVLDGILNIIWNEIKYKAEVKKDYGRIPLVECHPQQIGQVFLNVLMNAVQALERKGKILLRTYADKQFVFVEISDTGKGIPEGVLSRIFDPFFTTKKSGEGTGLGLSISYDIVKKHRGDIRVESVVGRGTTFTISLPLKNQNAFPL